MASASVTAGEEITFNAEESAGVSNFDTYDPRNVEGIDDRLFFYDWLADTATTSHITNMRDAFTTFEPLNRNVSGVGNTKTSAEGRGTVNLTTQFDNHKYLLTLQDVLYVPSNLHNLLSLGRWDSAGGLYQGGNGTLALIAKNGQTVATGTKINNHLYKIKNVTVLKPSPPSLVDSHSFAVREPAISWEMWHRRFGHIGYGSLRTLLTKELVTGFNVDSQSPKYDCVACTQAKQSVEPFPDNNNRTHTQPGELTHTDLWGPYSVRSIHGNEFFISFLDDCTRRALLRFLKHKDEGRQAVKDYVLYLRARGRNVTAFHCDRGTEFLNDDLLSWLREQGITVQPTAPYSPQQNGAAERLNRTLVELARAMMIARATPEFLWEYAIAHAAYLRERAPTNPLPAMTPYQAWHGQKPDISHLREFGSPVYILLQGHKEQPKLLPKSKPYLFVGFDDGSKSVKYYVAETRKVLTSRNFRFLTNLPVAAAPPEPFFIEPLPDVPREGELGHGTLQHRPHSNK